MLLGSICGMLRLDVPICRMADWNLVVFGLIQEGTQSTNSGGVFDAPELS